MNKLFSFMVLWTFFVFMSATVHAAELLEVKPSVSGSTVAVEISADKPMTYTYYKVPGQARAVVDIAEVDPEKIEPLIVVNKGVVSSISVDKAEISGMVVSRIIFNLTAETNISVTAATDRKSLTVTFGDTVDAMTPPLPAEREPSLTAELPVLAETAPPAPAGADEDPLGLDDPELDSATPEAASAALAATAATIPAVPVVTRVPKLEPVVPVSTSTPKPTALSITEVVAGDTFIDVRTNQTVTDFKSFRMAKPDRLIIDIAGTKILQKPRTITINKLGIAQARIGISPQYIRVVLDSNKAGFPAHTISRIDAGVRINFK